MTAAFHDVAQICVPSVEGKTKVALDHKRNLSLDFSQI